MLRTRAIAIEAPATGSQPQRGGVQCKIRRITVSAVYIFLAIILAPALIKVDLDPMAVHMFLMYWGMLSFITPPVALAAFAAASLAKSKPMETGFEAMRIGTIIYFIPFFFVFNPALLLQGPLAEIVIVIVTALVGILLVSAGLQGYLIGVGPLGGRVQDWFARLCLVMSGLAFAAPGGGMIGLSHTTLGLIAAAVAAPGILITWNSKRNLRCARYEGSRDHTGLNHRSPPCATETRPSFSLVLQTQQPRGICFHHEVDVRLRNAFLAQTSDHVLHRVGVGHVGVLTEVR